MRPKIYLDQRQKEAYKMAKKEKEIKVDVTFTEGYQKRFTEACLKQLKNSPLEIRKRA